MPQSIRDNATKPIGIVRARAIRTSIHPYWPFRRPGYEPIGFHLTCLPDRRQEIRLSATPRKASSTVRRTAAPVPMPAPPTPDGKAAAVLGGARSVFLAHGFSAATTDMIQAAAGVSKATVYARYATKEALFIAVIEAECERFLGTVRAPVVRPLKLRDALEAMAQAYLKVVLSPAGLALYRTVVGEAPR